MTSSATDFTIGAIHWAASRSHVPLRMPTERTALRPARAGIRGSRNRSTAPRIDLDTDGDPDFPDRRSRSLRPAATSRITTPIYTLGMSAIAIGWGLMHFLKFKEREY